ncbi:MAG: hypothetical protein HRF43_19915 [Phycisphaerae bacterium]|jgi:hypothetical protein
MRASMLIFVVVSSVLAGSARAEVAFVDDFTDNAHTQANWAFISPYQCVNPVFGTAFGASGVSGGHQLCVDSPYPVPPPLGGPAPTIGIAYVKTQTFTGDVAVFAGVKFTAQELDDTRAGTRRVIKAVMLRLDPRPAGGPGSPLEPAPTCKNNDGGEAYILNMDPASGGVDGPGGNDFSILVTNNKYEEYSAMSQGFVWQADVQYNVYFAANWDEAAQTNHIRAMLYTDDPFHPILDITTDDNSIKPGTVDPLNVNNDYVALAVTDLRGGPVDDICMGTSTLGPCGQAQNAFLATSALLPDAPADSDGDGVDNACDLCPDTLPGLLVDAQGCSARVPGDFDRDGDVGTDDRQHLWDCLSGPNIVQTAPGCADADLEGSDGDVDQVEFGIVQACFSGDNVPADPGCAG